MKNDYKYNKNLKKKTKKDTKKYNQKGKKQTKKKRATGFFFNRRKSIQPKTVQPKTIDKKTVIIKDNTPVEDRLISKSIQKILVGKKNLVTCCLLYARNLLKADHLLLKLINV